MPAPMVWVRVALADGQDDVFEGYEVQNCAPPTGDHVDFKIQWSGQSSNPPTNFLKLYFYLRNADLFSFQFRE